MVFVGISCLLWLTIALRKNKKVPRIHFRRSSTSEFIHIRQKKNLSRQNALRTISHDATYKTAIIIWVPAFSFVMVRLEILKKYVDYVHEKVAG